MKVFNTHKELVESKKNKISRKKLSEGSNVCKKTVLNDVSLNEEIGLGALEELDTIMPSNAGLGSKSFSDSRGGTDHTQVFDALSEIVRANKEQNEIKIDAISKENLQSIRDNSVATRIINFAKDNNVSTKNVTTSPIVKVVEITTDKQTGEQVNYEVTKQMLLQSPKLVGANNVEMTTKEDCYAFLLRIYSEVEIFGRDKNSNLAILLENCPNKYMVIPKPSLNGYSTNERDAYSSINLAQDISRFRTNFMHKKDKAPSSVDSVSFRSLALESAPGFGKTTGVAAWCKANGYLCYNTSLSAMDDSSWFGAPVPDAEDKGIEHYRTTFFDTLIENLDKPTVVFFDEANRSLEISRNALMEFMRTHELPLPRNSKITVPMTRTKDGAGQVLGDKVAATMAKRQGQLDWFNVAKIEEVDSETGEINKDYVGKYFLPNIAAVVLAYNPSESPELIAAGFNGFGSALTDRADTLWVSMSNEDFLKYMLEVFASKYSRIHDSVLDVVGKSSRTDDELTDMQAERIASTVEEFSSLNIDELGEIKERDYSNIIDDVKFGENEINNTIGNRANSGNLTQDMVNKLTSLFNQKQDIVNKIMFTYYLMTEKTGYGKPVFQFTDRNTYLEILRLKNEQRKAGERQDEVLVSPRTIEGILNSIRNTNKIGHEFFERFVNKCINPNAAILQKSRDPGVRGLKNYVEKVLSPFCEEYDNVIGPQISGGEPGDSYKYRNVNAADRVKNLMNSVEYVPPEKEKAEINNSTKETEAGSGEGF